MRNKKGSMIIETVIGIFTLCILAALIMNTTIALEKSSAKRKIKQEISSISFSIISELKYNYTLVEVNELIKENKLSFKYYNEFLLDLTNKRLVDFREGNNIVIKKVETIKNGRIEKYVIVFNIDFGEEIIKYEEEFIKSLWMEV
ncbi:hypothetical protein [Clostridium sp.]|uniref:hypothetical protein n=1 Tax=Clostridium sp. TaxID=1506 RepID=UPI003F34CAD7